MSVKNKGKMRAGWRVFNSVSTALLALSLLSVQSLVAQSSQASQEAGAGFLAQRWWLANEPLLGFVEIPAGSFPMGSNPLIDPMAFENERWSESRRQGIVDVPQFYIARYETTVAQFKAFVDAKQYNAHPESIQGQPDEPVSYVTWTDAVAYARWLDGELRGDAGTPEVLRRFLDEGARVSLATEAEWEKAAKGVDGRIYPWGNQVQSGKANFASTAVRTVGSFSCPECSFGLADMSGNVWEWTRSPYQAYPFDPRDDREFLSEDALWVMRGGSFSDEANNVRASVRGAADPGARRAFIGFRVVITKN